MKLYQIATCDTRTGEETIVFESFDYAKAARAKEIIFLDTKSEEHIRIENRVWNVPDDTNTEKVTEAVIGIDYDLF